MSKYRPSFRQKIFLLFSFASARKSWRRTKFQHINWKWNILWRFFFNLSAAQIISNFHLYTTDPLKTFLNPGKYQLLKVDTHLLLCCPVLCRNAFKVALRSSLIFSCKEETQRRISCWGTADRSQLKAALWTKGILFKFCYCQALILQQNPKHCNVLGGKNQFIYPGKKLGNKTFRRETPDLSTLIQWFAWF